MQNRKSQTDKESRFLGGVGRESRCVERGGVATPSQPPFPDPFLYT